MSEPRVFEGIAMYRDPYMDTDPDCVLVDSAGVLVSTDLDWLRDLFGKRVRITVEALDAPQSTFNGEREHVEASNG